MNDTKSTWAEKHLKKERKALIAIWAFVIAIILGAWLLWEWAWTHWMSV